MSFIKTAKDKPYNIPGTKRSIQSTQLMLTSSGTPSLDYILNGGLPCGSLFILEEDLYAEYSRVLLKYFLAEGLICNHHVLVASLDTDVKELIAELPEPTNQENDTTEMAIKDANHSLRIAWRYENVEPVDPSLNPNVQFGHHFDLSKRLIGETISTSNIDYWNYPNDTEDFNCGDFENPAFRHLLRTITKKLKEDTFNPSNHSSKSNILRIGLESMGSPFWITHDIQNSNTTEGKDIVKFIYCLRAVLRSTYGVAFLTIPSHLYKNREFNMIKRLRHAADFVLKFESFVGSDKETNPLFKDYHGLVYVKKLAAMNILTPYMPPALDLAFKLRRKKFIIEKLHLPPELQDSTEREQDDISSSVSCSGPNKKNVDF